MATAGVRARGVVEARWHAMGSDAHLVVVGGPGAGLLEAGRRRIGDLERRWSRFLPDSEVSAVNRDTGNLVGVSPDTLALFQRSVEGWRLTGGRFDPTVGAAVLAHGYDADIREVAARHGTDPPAPVTARPGVGLGGSVIDPWLPAVGVPVGTTFDPGAIGKGLAADLVVDALLEAGAEGALVSLGGDLRAAGTPPAPDGWTIAVADPRPGGGELVRMAVPCGAVATSGPLRRRWRTAGGEAHHIVDPSTGRPATSPVVAATVVAGEAWWAEVVATALHLAGPAGLADHPDVHALVVTTDGERHASPGLAGVLP